MPTRIRGGGLPALQVDELQSALAGKTWHSTNWNTMDPYKVLGIRPGASQAEIKSAYRRAAQKYHPDAGGDAWVFQQVQQAYQQLGGAQAAASAGGSGSQTRTSPDADASPAAAERAQQDTQVDKSRGAHGREPRQAHDSTIRPIERFRLRLKSWIDLAFRHQLPLQTETSLFILANMLDFFCTYILLQLNAIESNPLANYVLVRWGFSGMLLFKLLLVAFVCLLAQRIATQRPAYGRGVLVAGTAVVGLVVAYSLWLLKGQLS